MKETNFSHKNRRNTPGIITRDILKTVQDISEESFWMKKHSRYEDFIIVSSPYTLLYYARSKEIICGQ